MDSEPTKTHINDLPNDIILHILKDLGLRSELDPRTLRRMRPAFNAASICTRWYNIFMNAITKLDTAVVKYETHFAPTIAAMEVPHIAWLCRNAHNLEYVTLTEHNAAALNELGSHAKLEYVEVISGESWPVLKCLAPSVNVVLLDFPSVNTLKFLTRLPVRHAGNELKKLYLGSKVEQLPLIREMYRRLGATLEDVLITFYLTFDSPQRRQGMERITAFVGDMCTSCAVEMPRIHQLAFSVAQSTRFNHSFHPDLGFLYHMINEMRTSNTASPPPNLQCVFLYTECDTINSWLQAAAPLIAHNVAVVVEAGIDAMMYFPTIMAQVGLSAVHHDVRFKFLLANVRRAQLKGYTFASGRLPVLSVCERTVVQRFIGDDEYRSFFLDVVNRASVDKFHLVCPLSNNVLKLGMPLDEDSPADTTATDEMMRVANVLLSQQGSAEDMSVEFLHAVLPCMNQLDELMVSFELVQLALSHTADVHAVLGAMDSVTKLVLIMPTAIPMLDGLEHGSLDVTEKFLIGLPVFLDLLEGSLPKLEALDIGKIAKKVKFEVAVRERVAMFQAAFEALDQFDERRSEVCTEPMRVLLETLEGVMRKGKRK